MASSPRASTAVTAQQYFPTYRVPSDSEITLREYDLSAQGLAADQRGISVAAGLLVILGGGLTSIAASDNGGSYISSLAKSAAGQTEALAYLATLGLAVIAIRYLTELQRSAAHGARKIIILRRLLGVDYGNIERVLPSSRLEGANEPFAIPLFPGWGATVSLAAITVAGAAAYLMYGLANGFIMYENSAIFSVTQVTKLSSQTFPLYVALIAWLAIIALYRRWLFEDWETVRLFVARSYGWVAAVPLKQRMGYVLYRLELSVFEANRLGLDLSAFYDMLIRIEDRRFFKHCGNSVYAIFAAIYRRVRYKSVGGISTIPQQLSRSNLISVLPKGMRRKIIEWILAPWVVERFPKKYILDLYLCSVRFATGVEGVPAALRYYFNSPLDATNPWNPSKAQIFFLIERLSNISRTIPIPRIRVLARDAMAQGFLAASDLDELKRIYESQVAAGRLQPPQAPIQL